MIFSGNCYPTEVTNQAAGPDVANIWPGMRSIIPGFLASVMLVAAAPVCSCAEALNSHRASPGRTPSHPHPGPMSERRLDDQPLPETGDRSGDPGPSCPESCRYTSKSSLAALVSTGKTAGSPDRQSPASFDGAKAILHLSPTAKQALGKSTGRAASVMQAAIFSKGNPYQLLSRWLC